MRGKEFVFFWKAEKEPYGWFGVVSCGILSFFLRSFSNWYMRETPHNNMSFWSSEHHFMYLKAVLMRDHEVAQKILHCKSPHEAKKLGRAVRQWNEKLWLAKRESIMYEACMAKFTVHDDLRAKLLGTGDAVLVEASPLDKIWGIGLAEDDAGARNEKAWQGLNLLGKVLMHVRSDLFDILRGKVWDCF